jgi:hypothetical protein
MTQKQKQVAEKMIRGRFAGLKAAARGAIPGLAVAPYPTYSLPSPKTVEGVVAPTQELQDKISTMAQLGEEVKEEWVRLHEQAQEDHRAYSEKASKLTHFLDVKLSQAIEKLWLSDLPEAQRMLNELVNLEDLAKEMKALGLPAAKLPKELPPADL